MLAGLDKTTTLAINGGSVPTESDNSTAKPDLVRRGEEVSRLVSSLVDQILADDWLDPQTVVLGIANGGVALGGLVARLLARQSGFSLPYGVVETSFHRDDIGSRPIPIVAHPTDVPVNVEGGKVLLVDDVIASGRTIRAALNETFDQGRPESIRLAVLLDRGGRKLPVQPDYLADRIAVDPDRILSVTIDEEDPGGHRIESSPR